MTPVAKINPLPNKLLKLKHKNKGGTAILKQKKIYFFFTIFKPRIA